MENCGIIIDDPIYEGSDHSCECERPFGHVGPHLIQCKDGTPVAYETDLFCFCEICRSSDDPNEWCGVYRAVSTEEVTLLKATTEEGITLVSLAK